MGTIASAQALQLMVLLLYSMRRFPQLLVVPIQEAILAVYCQLPALARQIVNFRRLTANLAHPN
jgi:hypothetical protein